MTLEDIANDPMDIYEEIAKRFNRIENELRSTRAELAEIIRDTVVQSGTPRFFLMPERPTEQGWYLVIASWVGSYSNDTYYEYVVSYYEKGTFQYLPLDYKVVAWTKLNDPKEEFKNAGIQA